MRAVKRFGIAIAAALAIAALSVPARGAQCGKGPEGFPDWLEAFKAHAEKAGIPSDAIELALAGVAYDSDAIDHDRKLHGFGQNFEKFAARRVTPNRIRRGKEKLLSYAEALDAIETRYGVPGPVLVAIWGLESEFGAGTGDAPTFDVLATLAYDCRRPEKFGDELIAALRLVQRGALRVEDMKGAWAGEIGQTQFMPSTYLKYAVSYDGLSAPDLIHRSADALASTANFLVGHGWKRGEAWDEGDPNYAALLEWNAAPVYAKTIALFADRLAEP